MIKDTTLILNEAIETPFERIANYHGVWRITTVYIHCVPFKWNTNLLFYK